MLRRRESKRSGSRPRKAVPCRPFWHPSYVKLCCACRATRRPKILAQRGLRALAGFAKALKVKYQDIEVGLDFDPEPGLADNADLEHDLQDLLEAAGAAGKKSRHRAGVVR